MGILGIIVGILALLCAFVATFLFGTTGGIVAGVIGAAAIVLGFLKKKKDGKGGTGSIVIGVLALVLTFALTNTWSTMFSKLHDTAVQNKPDGLWAQVSENTNGGLMGIVNKLPTDEASISAIMEEMSELNKLIKN